MQLFTEMKKDYTKYFNNLDESQCMIFYGEVKNKSDVVFAKRFLAGEFRLEEIKG